MSIALSHGQLRSISISGYVIDQETGEHLPGAVIFDKNQNVASVSNNFGFYSISLKRDSIDLQVSFIGYQTFHYTEYTNNDLYLDVKLERQTRKLDEVVISSQAYDFIDNTEMGTHVLDMSLVTSISTFGGEPDIIKSLQLLPGIQSSHEGTTNLSVRGGSFDQNLFLLDDAPVYNPSHALSFFSIFNTDAIKNVKVYKSSMPAQYGGKLSSIVDIGMKEGNNKSTNVSGSIGLMASSLTVESPIIKEKSPFMLSGRYSYAGHTVNSLYSMGQLVGAFNNSSTDNEIHFFDINAKFNYALNDKNHLYFSTYTGRDHFYFLSIDDESSMDWGNSIANLRWNHIHGPRLFSNTMLVYSHYDYEYFLKDDAKAFTWSANMNEFDLKSDFDFYKNASNHMKFGFTMDLHRYFPGRIEPKNKQSITHDFELDSKKAVIIAGYLSNEYTLSPKLKLNYGLRYAAFNLLGRGISFEYDENFNVVDSSYYTNNESIQFYHGIEPRLSAVYLLNDRNSLKISYDRTKQYQHLLSNSGVGLPTDVWIPSDQYIKPQSADQVSLGYYVSTHDASFEISAEVYVRTLKNIIDFKDNAKLFLNSELETQILSGTGKSYGLELYLQKKKGNFMGWISYTLSKTTRKIEGINDSKTYPATFDKRHNLAILTSYRLSNRTSISSTFKLTSGGYATLPAGTFRYYGASFNYYTDRNGYQLPIYHRLDVALNIEAKKNKDRKWKGEWSLGIYNLYGKKNIFSLFIKQDELYLSTSHAYKMYLSSVAPYVTYRFRF